MDTSETSSDQKRSQIVLTDTDTMVPAPRSSSSRRSPSFSSSSSLSSSSSSSGSSYFFDDYTLSPATPLRFSGSVPFSWENLPGIPKKQNSIRKKDYPNLLPLPPLQNRNKHISHGETGNNSKKKTTKPETFHQRDPFFAAFVECSKEDDDSGNNNHWTGAKVTRSISDRFGFVSLYSSCKNTCSVSESIVHLPRSRRTGYHLIGISRRFS